MKSITFRCKRSGNIVSFTLDGDIAGMRKHEGYVEVNNDAQTAETVQAEPQASPVKEVLKRPGRPAKVPSFLA